MGAGEVGAMLQASFLGQKEKVWGKDTTYWTETVCLAISCVYPHTASLALQVREKMCDNTGLWPHTCLHISPLQNDLGIENAR